MRKALLLVAVLALALGITYLVLHKSGSDDSKPEQKDPALLVNSKSSAFNRSFTAVLSSYYQLSDAFIAKDTALMAAACQNLSIAVDSIRFDQFKADTSIVQTAMSLAQSLPGEIDGLRGEKTMEQKKREFNMITEDLYSLIRTVKYDGSVIYHISCPTAFADSTEGFWLSPSATIVNPYSWSSHSGNTISAECGEVRDSLHFLHP